jgi:hypothetical protein
MNSLQTLKESGSKWLKYSYQDKAKALKDKLPNKQAKLSKVFYKNKSLNIYDLLEIKSDFNDVYGIGAWEVSNALNQAKYKRKQRIQERIQKMVEQGASFLTLTFTDEVLSITSEATRRQYVRRWLKTLSHNYVANIDYGAKNGREHYHAVIPYHDHLPEWPFGFKLSQKVGSSNSDLQSISKYVAKLTNHSMKQTASLKRIIYAKL